LNKKLEQQVRNVYVERKVRTTGKKVWMFTIYLVLYYSSSPSYKTMPSVMK